MASLFLRRRAQASPQRVREPEGADCPGCAVVFMVSLMGFLTSFLGDP